MGSRECFFLQLLERNVRQAYSRAEAKRVGLAVGAAVIGNMLFVQAQNRLRHDRCSF
jgi:hypothetical protein